MPKELLFSVTAKDLTITYFSGKGGGGQHRNRHKNCVKMVHSDSGATGVGQRERSLTQNKRVAFRTLVDSKKFKAWLKLETSKALMSTQEKERAKKRVDKELENAMQPENIKVEYI